MKENVMTNLIRPPRMKYCKKCVYPIVSINNLLDDEGICSACRMQEEFDDLKPDFWADREEKFRNIVQWAKKSAGDSYDCIVPVSGGKDSYFQVHKVLQYGLKPLLVTYHGNNYLPEGQHNLDRMRKIFNADHMVFGPSVDTLQKLNRLCFRMMGDMNWHAHAGIKTYPLKIAVAFKIPLVVWGEVTWTISGMFSPDDYVEYNKRTVLEHDMRGFTLNDMVGGEERLTERDLIWLKMPSDDEIQDSGTRGIYIGNFFPWDPNRHAAFVRNQYGFKYSRETFDRTYRRMSNLDDMHENGIHDYLKFIKFGYGRASDHASKDIRSGDMSREQAIEMVREYDHVKPRDLQRWLGYTGLSEYEFDRIADSFRDSRVWWKDGDGKWKKDNVWD